MSECIRFPGAAEETVAKSTSFAHYDDPYA